MGRLTKYFFETLPEYFHIYDTYKADDPDLLERGLLERYMLAVEEDSEVIDTQIDELNRLPFPLLTLPRYLSDLASMYGSPPDTFGDVDWYRELLRNIVDINKMKGTLEGFSRFFGVMGMNVAITATQFDEINYDDTDGEPYDQSTFLDDVIRHYDTGTGQTLAIHYDSTCFPCVNLDIDLTTKAGATGTPDPTTDALKRAYQSIFLYLFPINAMLGTFTIDAVEKDISLTNNLIRFTP